MQQSIPFGDRDTLSLGLRAAGTTLRDAIFTNYRLGGFLEISGLRTTELQGPYLGRARAVYLRRVGTLPVIGKAYFVGGSLEIGNVWPSRDVCDALGYVQGGQRVRRRRHDIRTALPRVGHRHGRQFDVVPAARTTLSAGVHT